MSTTRSDKLVSSNVEIPSSYKIDTPPSTPVHIPLKSEELKFYHFLDDVYFKYEIVIKNTTNHMYNVCYGCNYYVFLYNFIRHVTNIIY